MGKRDHLIRIIQKTRDSLNRVEASIATNPKYGWDKAILLGELELAFKDLMAFLDNINEGEW